MQTPAWALMAQAGLFAEELWNVDGDEQRRKRRKTAAAMTSVVALVTHHLLEEEMMLRRRILYLHEAGLLRNPPPPRRILRFRLMPRIDEDLPESFMEETFRFSYTELRGGLACVQERSYQAHASPGGAILPPGSPTPS